MTWNAKIVVTVLAFFSVILLTCCFSSYGQTMWVQ